MAYKITEDCAACGTCILECPLGAISEGDIYKIDPSICVDCGHCADACPMSAIIVDGGPLPPPESQLQQDMAKYANEVINKKDLIAGFQLLSEITGGMLIFGTIATALTSWIPGAGIPISSATAAYALNKISDVYINLPTEDRRLIIKCANLLKNVI